MNRLQAIIGDVHGEVEQLIELAESLNDRQLIFVGDYVNRGGDSRKTLDYLIALQERDSSTVFLLGNHEVALLDFLEEKLSFHEFAAVGGIPTIRAYLGRAAQDVRSEMSHVFPDRHREFLTCCRLFYETPDLLVSHCGIDPANPLSRARSDMVMGYHHGLFTREFDASKLIVCGHYAQASGHPYISTNVICLDTGCGTAGGPLTALLMPERIILQR